jgi:hypothetical protein
MEFRSVPTYPYLESLVKQNWCTFRGLCLHSWEVLQNCSTFLCVSFFRGRKSEKISENLRELREFLFHKIRTLECHANGHPKPKIKWLREDKGNFTVYDRNNKRMIGKHVRAGIKRDSTVLPYMKCIKTIHIGFEGRARKTTIAVDLRTALC